jgi:hypothetical protein
MRKNNFTSNDEKTRKSYVDTVSKLTRFIDKGKSSLQSPTNSIAKAIRNKEKTEEIKNLMMNEIANQFNLFKTTILSNGSESEKDDDVPKLEALPKTETEASKQKLAERVFWTKDKMEKVREQLRTARTKIYEKTRHDFQELFIAIDTGQREKIL